MMKADASAGPQSADLSPGPTRLRAPAPPHLASGAARLRRRGAPRRRLPRLAEARAAEHLADAPHRPGGLRQLPVQHAFLLRGQHAPHQSRTIGRGRLARSGRSARAPSPGPRRLRGDGPPQEAPSASRLRALSKPEATARLRGLSRAGTELADRKSVV